jgi:hypothetical protein
VGGKTRGAVRACLDVLAPPFASRQKVEKQSSSKCLKRTKTFTATLRQAQGDKAGEAGAIAVKQND